MRKWWIIDNSLCRINDIFRWEFPTHVLPLLCKATWLHVISFISSTGSWISRTNKKHLHSNSRKLFHRSIKSHSIPSTGTKSLTQAKIKQTAFRRRVSKSYNVAVWYKRLTILSGKAPRNNHFCINPHTQKWKAQHGPHSKSPISSYIFISCRIIKVHDIALRCGYGCYRWRH